MTLTSCPAPPAEASLRERLTDAEATIAMVRIIIARAQADGSNVVAIQALEEVLGDANVAPGGIS